MITKTALVNRLHEKQMFDTEFKDYIKDKKFPLEERWDNFKFACENKIFVNVESWVVHLKTLESSHNFSWYDNFGFERYETVDFVFVVGRITEQLSEIEADNDPEIHWRDIHTITTQKQLAELKEEILATGYSGFEMDW